ncbi:hypothetical protein KAR91_20345 [Candidatus Pacearchaeota archaeon]|nr:hypothetical protein [Candidatus Pacearchaeota archaeon]
MSKFDFLTPEFIKAHHKAAGIRVIPDIFPWKYLGCTDTDFMETKVNFSHGGPIPDEHKLALLGVIRQQEKELMERRDYLARREKVMGKPPKNIQLELF